MTNFGLFLKMLIRGGYKLLSRLFSEFIWDPKQNFEKLYFERTIPLSTESFTGFISIHIRIIIMSKLEIFKN